MKHLFLRILIVFFVLLGTTNLMANTTKVDIIFVMDTSGSMNDEASALVNAIGEVTSDLSSELDLDSKLWGIADNGFSGLTSYVRAEISNPISNHSEDWAPAVNDISSKYMGWRDETVKIVVPISDECPEDGDECYENDEIAITNARQEAETNGINVLPIVGSNDWGTYSKVKQLASNLSTVNGKIITTSSSVYKEEMKEAIREIVASVTGDIVLPPSFDNYFIFGNYINIPITKASGAKGVEWQVKENDIIIDGQSTTSIDKVSIYVTDNQSHEYNVSARSVGVDKMVIPYIVIG